MAGPGMRGLGARWVGGASAPGGSAPPPTMVLPDVDRSPAAAFVEDYRPAMIQKDSSTTRLYMRQRRATKKMKRGEERGKWFDRLLESNSMRAALLVSAM